MNMFNQGGCASSRLDHMELQTRRGITMLHEAEDHCKSTHLAGCTRSRFENSFKMYVIEWTIIESLSVSETKLF